MALIKCPACGQTVLSIASACPKCSAALSDTHIPINSAGSLSECRRCGRPVASEVRSCPHCGVRGPVSAPGIRVLVAAMAFALVGTLAASEILPEHWAREEPVTSPVAAGDTQVTTIAAAATPAVPDTAAVSDPARTDSLAPDSAARVIAAPEPPAAKPESTVARSDSLPVDPGPRRIPGSRQLWTTVWTNVRAGRGDSTPVVTVLRPHEQVAALKPRDGWSMVYVDGIAVGYVAGSLLTSARPTP